jgi:hypothetical protein
VHLGQRVVGQLSQLEVVDHELRVGRQRGRADRRGIGSSGINGYVSTLSRNCGVRAFLKAKPPRTVRWRRRSAHEFLNAPTGSVFDQMADGQGGEHDRQVSLDGFAKAATVVGRGGTERANCGRRHHNIKRRECPSERLTQPLSYCLPATVTLPNLPPTLPADRPGVPHRAHYPWL